jgi:hypothetical protein
MAAVPSLWTAPALALSYNVTIVQFELGSETFTEAGSLGSVTGQVFSSNLPIDLSTSSASYAGSVGQGFGIGGTWSLIGGDNALSGTFDDLLRFGSPPGAPLVRGTATTMISGGTGLFEGASGAGTFEIFSRDLFGASGPEYQQVVVHRLQLDVPNKPGLTPQTDFRNVVVSARLGVNDLVHQTGVNIGGPTSDDAPGSFPRLTQLRSEYGYSDPDLNHGVSESRNIDGDAQHWTFDFAPGHSLTDYFFFGQGEADMIGGEGFYEGYTGHSDWMSFESWMFQLSPQMSTYSSVVIDRYELTAPVPEPQTYLMLLAGLAVIAVVARGRLSVL